MIRVCCGTWTLGDVVDMLAEDLDIPVTASPEDQTLALPEDLVPRALAVLAEWGLDAWRESEEERL